MMYLIEIRNEDLSLLLFAVPLFLGFVMYFSGLHYSSGLGKIEACFPNISIVNVFTNMRLEECYMEHYIANPPY